MAKPTLVVRLRENPSCIFIKSAKKLYNIRKDGDNDMMEGQQHFSKDKYKFDYDLKKRELCLKLNNDHPLLLGQIENTPEAENIAQRLSQLT